MRKRRLRPLLVFTGKYIYEPKLNREGVVNSAALLKDSFFTKKGLNLNDQNACVIEDNKYVEGINRIRTFISGLNAETDIPLIYFCGHGFPDYENNSVMLSMSDTTSESWKYTGINHRTILGMLKDNRIRQYILILDCCYSGFLCDMGLEGKGIEACLNVRDDSNSEGVVYISSTQRDDRTKQKLYDDKYYVPFSYHFANTLLNETSLIDTYFSIKDIFEIVQPKLVQDLPDSSCVIQNKGSLAETKLFKKVPIDKIKSNEGFLFSDYFNSPELRVLLVKTAIKYPIKYECDR